MNEVEVEARFWEKVDTHGPDDCWEWLAGKLRGGYGSFSFNGRTARAHKVAYLLEVGDVPDGMCVCHKCDNRSCVNPGHLFLGTQADNLADMVAKERSAKGSDNGNAKLPEQDVEEIRSLYETGKYVQRELAKQFGVSRSQIGRIVRGENWGWL